MLRRGQHIGQLLRHHHAAGNTLGHDHRNRLHRKTAKTGLSRIDQQVEVEPGAFEVGRRRGDDLSGRRNTLLVFDRRNQNHLPHLQPSSLMVSERTEVWFQQLRPA